MTSSAARVVVLGDTRDLHHHGCEAVMAQLLDGLAAVGLPADEVIASFDWSTHPQCCLDAALLVINGEGALHDNRPVVRQVLGIAARRRALGRPTALVNSSWFANDAASTAELKNFDLVALRDPASRRTAACAGIVSLEAPDLAIREALARRTDSPAPVIGPVMVSDSTRPETTRILRNLAKRRRWTYLPVLYPPSHPRPGAKSRKICRKCQLARWLGPMARLLMSPRYHAHLLGAPDLAAYCQRLRESSGVLTGRFHTACLCVGLGVPVVAIASNTPKIESLMTDAGLDLSTRMVTTQDLDQMTGVPPYSPAEVAALERFRIHSEQSFQDLFARIRALLPARG